MDHFCLAIVVQKSLGTLVQARSNHEMQLPGAEVNRLDFVDNLSKCSLIRLSEQRIHVGATYGDLRAA